MDEPQFIHDCEKCVFLGTHENKYGEYDLYFCQPTFLESTVVARWSNEGPDYNSGLPAVGLLEELTEAAKRAIAKGLLDPNKKAGRIDRKTIQENIDNPSYK